MIRVFLLGVLGLIALALVARSLPKYDVRRAPVVDGAVAADGSGLFARWAGVWEGEFTTRRPDGTLVAVTKVRQEYTDVNDNEQNVVITDWPAGGAAIVSSGTNRSGPDGLECVLTDPNGVTKLLEGRQAGSAIIWHRHDAEARVEETFREEILAMPGGDVYTIDGFGIYGGATGTVLLFEGRYHRAGSQAR